MSAASVSLGTRRCLRACFDRGIGILIVAIGQAKFVTADMVRPGAVVVDVGINRSEIGVVGDIDFAAVREVAGAINKAFGSFASFREKFAAAAAGQFGSGWAWLTLTPDGSLQVSATPNQDSPLMDGNRPLLGIDVWEHAYYLKYQNKRADYIDAWWNVVNWNQVAENLRKARG